MNHEEAVERSRVVAEEILSSMGDDTILLYGVPRGGVPAAYLVAEAIRDAGRTCSVIDVAQVADVIIDDIIDSGRTRARYADLPFYALVDKTKEPNIGWVTFPWEVSATVEHEDTVTRFIEAIGDDPRRDGLLDTPKRVVKSWKEIYKGYTEDPRVHLERTFENEEKYDEMVLVRNVEFYSMCEHHMLPFFGKAHVAYIPGESGRVVGLSKIARLVDGYARRLQIQERLTQQIAVAIEETLKPLGVSVILEAQHLCMIARGARQSEAVMVTSAIRGVMKDDQRSRMEMLLLRK